MGYVLSANSQDAGIGRPSLRATLAMMALSAGDYPVVLKRRGSPRRPGATLSRSVEPFRTRHRARIAVAVATAIPIIRATAWKAEESDPADCLSGARRPCRSFRGAPLRGFPPGGRRSQQVHRPRRWWTRVSCSKIGANGRYAVGRFH